MTAHVIDTNVPAVANGRHGPAGAQCLANCVEFLLEIKRSGLVLLDDRHRIMREYAANLRKGGQPRTGWQFYKWLRDRRTSAQCREVTITQVAGPAEDYAEFPADPDLAGFDPSDRKFVAVAVASGLSPEIAIAIDRGWSRHHAALVRNGVPVRFLCPDVCPPGV